MKSSVCLCLLLVAGLTACGKSDKPSSPKTTNAAAAGDNPLSAPADYLGGMVKAKNLADKTIDTAALNQAVNLFNAQEGRFPKDLNELVSQGYLPRIPTAPTGSKITYNAANGQVKVVKQ